MKLNKNGYFYSYFIDIPIGKAKSVDDVLNIVKEYILLKTCGKLLDKKLICKTKSVRKINLALSDRRYKYL